LLVKVLKEWIDICWKEVFPVRPIMLPCLESRRHGSSFDVGVNSMDKVCPISALGRQQRVQEASCGRGKHEWKAVRNVRWSGCEANDLDAKSALVLSAHAMCCVVIGDAWQVSMQSAKMRRIRAALVTLVESRHVAHATVGVLLLRHATCACWRFLNCSRTIHCRRSPVISRLELEIFPFGFASDTIAAWISGGKGTLHTIGGRARFSPNHMPPAPALEASQYLP